MSRQADRSAPPPQEQGLPGASARATPRSSSTPSQTPERTTAAKQRRSDGTSEASPTTPTPTRPGPDAGAPSTRPVPSAPTPTRPATDPSPRPAGSSSAEPSTAGEILALVNAERDRAGLAPVRADGCLSETLAQPWAQHLADIGDLVHQDLGEALSACGGLGAAGENIAYGQTTPAEVMDGWMNSSGHRANILNPSFTRLGVGRVEGADGRIYWVQVFGG
ncbi:MAG: CAP domain-containing protein [Propioniciclava sp.]